MNIDEIKINSRSGYYSVYFDQKLEKLKELLLKKTSVVYIIDRNVWELYRNELFSNIPLEQTILIDAIEENKEYYAIGKIIPLITELQAKKNLTIVAIGGGIIQDLAGFIASIIYRGIEWIFIPTTLLAQADSCIGAKTSINFDNFKNLLGTFWAPNEIWLSTLFLDTLVTKDFYSGIGEIVKLFLIDGEESLVFYNSLNAKSEEILRENISILLERSLLIKKRFIEEDEFDKGIRNILNFGHCIGHAIESVTNYAIPHGQAVTLGMIWANIISTKMNILSESKKDFIYNNYLKNSHTISNVSLNFNPELIVNAMKKDKKREGEDLAIILMDENYKYNRIKDLKADMILESFSDFILLFQV